MNISASNDLNNSFGVLNPSILVGTGVETSTSSVDDSLAVNSPIVAVYINSSCLIYNIAKYLMLKSELDLVEDDIKVILVNGYVPDIDNHDYYSSVSTFESVGNNYTSGGELMTNKSFVRSNLNDRTSYSADDVRFSSISVNANGAVLYKYTGDYSTSPLVGFVSFGSEKTANGTDFLIKWNDRIGILYIT